MARKQKGLTSEGRLFLLARANTDKEGTYCNCKVTNPTRDARTVLPCKTTGEGEGRGLRLGERMEPDPLYPRDQQTRRVWFGTYKNKRSRRVLCFGLSSSKA
jgi:hypothetical protein